MLPEEPDEPDEPEEPEEDDELELSDDELVLVEDELSEPVVEELRLVDDLLSLR